MKEIKAVIEPHRPAKIRLALSNIKVFPCMTLGKMGEFGHFAVKPV